MYVGAINVNALSTNAMITIGENSQSNWSTHSKNNYGQGQGFGMNWMLAPVSFIFDNDFIDTPISDPDVAFAPQGQTL